VSVLHSSQPGSGPPPGGRVVIGLDLGGTTLQGAVVHRDGRMVLTHRVPTPRDGFPGVVCDAVAELSRQLLSEADEAGLRPVAVGVGTPGAVDPHTGTVVGAAPNLPQWVGVNLREPVVRATGLPVVVDNDANMAALGEGAFGAAKGCRQFVCLTLGTGIGAGIVVDGQLVRGSGFAAGEAGHMIVHEGGNRCECGSFGCLEAHASAGALTRMAGVAVGRLPQSVLAAGSDDGARDARDVFDAARRGDPLARELLCDVAAHLGAGIACIVSLLDPERVILTGGMAEAGEDFLLQVTTAAARRLMPVFARRLCVRLGALGSWAGVVGAGFAAWLDSRKTPE
jgi:glucokinase